MCKYGYSDKSATSYDDFCRTWIAAEDPRQEGLVAGQSGEVQLYAVFRAFGIAVCVGAGQIEIGGDDTVACHIHRSFPVLRFCFVDAGGGDGFETGVRQIFASADRRIERESNTL